MNPNSTYHVYALIVPCHRWRNRGTATLRNFHQIAYQNGALDQGPAFNPYTILWSISRQMTMLFLNFSGQDFRSLPWYLSLSHIQHLFLHFQSWNIFLGSPMGIYLVSLSCSVYPLHQPGPIHHGHLLPGLLQKFLISLCLPLSPYCSCSLNTKQKQKRSLKN